jgi:hypothetical protein
MAEVPNIEIDIILCILSIFLILFSVPLTIKDWK